MRVLSMEELRTAKGINYSRAHIYRLLKTDPDFPQPIRLGGNRIAFVEEEVDRYLADKVAARDAERGREHA